MLTRNTLLVSALCAAITLAGCASRPLQCEPVPARPLPFPSAPESLLRDPANKVLVDRALNTTPSKPAPQRTP